MAAAALDPGVAADLRHFPVADAALLDLELDLDRVARPEIIQRSLTDARRAVVEHEGAELYDRAMELYDAGDHEGARMLLEVWQSFPPPRRRRSDPRVDSIW